MKKRFDERGIEIPFPHRTLSWGEPKRGEAAALPIAIRELERPSASADQGQRHIVASESGGSEAG
jgi:small conductance mechanosensitive channel